MPSLPTRIARKALSYLPIPRTIGYQGLTVPLESGLVPRPVVQQLRSNDYEKPEIRAMRAILRPGDRVIELGTGLGIVSALASRAASGVTVETWEANPAMLGQIAALHRLNGITNVTSRHGLLAVNPQAATERFFQHRYFPESSVIDSDQMTGSVDVPLVDINAELRRFGPDVMICDIEGGESRLFNGLQLGNLRALVIELHPLVIPRSAIKAIYDCCLAHGLCPVIEHSRAQVVTFERVETA